MKEVEALELSEWIAVGSVALAFMSFAVQLFLNRQQTKAEALIKICEGNRELIGLGFSQTKLLTIFGGDDEEGELRRRYCQLWLNQVELMFRLKRPMAFASAQWHGTLRDMRDFMGVPVMRSHWQSHREFYGEDFQQFVEEVLYDNNDNEKKDEAPTCEASPVLSGQEDST